MNFSMEEDHVRVDFFKPSGKWGYTESIKFRNYRGDPLENFACSLRDHFSNVGTVCRFEGMTAVCLHPWSQYDYPLMIKDGGWNGSK